MVSQGFFVVIRGCVYQYVSVGCVSNPDNCKASECLFGSALWTKRKIHLWLSWQCRHWFSAPMPFLIGHPFFLLPRCSTGSATPTTLLVTCRTKAQNGVCMHSWISRNTTTYPCIAENTDDQSIQALTLFESLILHFIREVSLSCFMSSKDKTCMIRRCQKHLLRSHCLKITPNFAFEFLNWNVFHQFLTY